MAVNTDGRGKEFCLWGCDENALKLTLVVAAQLCDYTKNYILYIVGIVYTIPTNYIL